MSWAPYLAAAWILLVGLYGVATTRNLVHAVVCVSVAQSSTYVLLLLVGYRRGGTSPVFSDTAPGSRPVTDPVVQAMALTDIVVGATVTALLLALAVQVAKRRGTLDPAGLRSLESEAGMRDEGAR
ncbi:sodium:proton antiporter [Actinomadura atramentaria]|uniref:sodium:proton antiporter n=1 Tax=Actinomadura atramentaria TaxID=1990 RepID=UPI00037591BE|nr:cation:proton antiporter subunit C [Actinomadura atramentaria]